MIDGILELKRRVEELDTINDYIRARSKDGDLIHFINVLEQITSSGSPLGADTFLCTSPHEADVIQQSCKLLKRLENIVPEIVIGPLRRNIQFWIGTGKSGVPLKNDVDLSVSQFRDISHHENIYASTKPFYVGLFTSTGISGGYGMWRIYLEKGGSSTQFPRPWHIWAVEPDENVSVREISSAADWVQFVISYPTQERGFLYPDWRLAAQNFDAVHVTLRAIVAIQGIQFSTPYGCIAPSYWDLESTFWLRWCFQSVNRIGTIV